MKIAHYRHVLLLCLAMLTACGFHLRGANVPAFQSIYIEQHGAPAITNNLRRALQNSGVEVLPSPEGAEMHLELVGENTQRKILSLSGDGKVREYELIYQVTVRMRRGEEALWGAPQLIELRRDFSYDDAWRLAKETEEARLYNDIRGDMVREIMRRLSSQRIEKPSAAN